MTVPGRPILFVSIVIAITLVAAIAIPEMVPIALAADLLLIGLCLWEGRRLARMPVEVTRENWQRVQLDRTSDMVYRMENRGNRPVWVFVRQPWPATLECKLNTLEVRIEPGEAIRAAMSVTPRRRGRVVVAPAEVDIRFPGGLARRRWNLPDEATLSVYPSLEGLNEFEAMRRSHALRQYGIHNIRMIGAGREFDQLRDYVPDDEYSSINWKATARHRKPITNLYQAEKSQDVMLCLDCGRMMGNPIGRGTTLDRAIDASLMLAHVASRYGDRVGLAIFRETVTRFLKPAAGAVGLTRIIQELVDAHPEGVFPSYAALAGALRAKHRRRSIIFLFTDLNDPQLATNLVEVLPLLSRRHVVVVVSLRDPLLDRIAGGAAEDRRQLYQSLAATELANERDSHTRELIKAGVQVLESDADSLTISVINRYLTVKRRQLL